MAAFTSRKISLQFHLTVVALAALPDPLTNPSQIVLRQPEGHGLVPILETTG